MFYLKKNIYQYIYIIVIMQKIQLNIEFEKTHLLNTFIFIGCKLL